MKIGVVGHGSIGKRHAENARALGHEVRTYDPVGVHYFKFERELYDWCDAAVISTPSQFHEAGLRACVERGKHCLVEKPISVGTGALLALLDVADAKGLVVMIANNLRFHPCVQQAKEWITAGHIGEPLWSTFTCATQSVKPTYLNDGVTLNTGSHEVDLAIHFLGPVSKVLSATCSPADQISYFVLEHESGARSSFHLDFVTPNEIREFWIAGSEKNIGVDLPSRRISLGSMSTGHAGDYDRDYIAEIEAFTDRIDGKITPGATGRDGLAVLRALLDVRKMAGIA